MTAKKVRTKATEGRVCVFLEPEQNEALNIARKQQGTVPRSVVAKQYIVEGLRARGLLK